ncbi:MAG: hypothetical protein GY806_18060 [Gammaproteobacteria bacterium]|nr:hypothetical protein [Gammaproteobacteria bacterium]
MMEVSAALFILLIEGLIGLLVTLILVLFMASRKKRRRLKAIAQLVAQIKKQSEVRISETGSFLQDIYQLEGDDLKKAVEMIDKGEKHLYQILINGFLTEDPKIITSIDASVAELIDIYKDLKPKVEEVQVNDEAELETLRKQIEELQNTNKKLDEELNITKTTMGNMIAEFGNMFGGGSDHELANFEVVEKVGATSDEVEEVIEEA